MVLNKVNTKVVVLFCLLFCLYGTVNAQVSSGGTPVQLPVLKSASSQNNIYELPVDEIVLPEQNLTDYPFKSIKYAHTFEVVLNPRNSGRWFTVGDTRVWQLHLKSTGAKSLNVIFSKYRLPAGASLFLFNPDGSYVLGAFTEFNNKEFGKLATMPVPGDELIIQYEEPAAFKGEVFLELGMINHDFLGVMSMQNRFDRRYSGYCNVDIHCDPEGDAPEISRAVCRVFCIDELGTGTLITNVENDGKPYLISAFHTFDKKDNTHLAVFDFNYESPYCTKIDGYDVQSISGGLAIAGYEKLDFMLIELSLSPPKAYRPYYSGWDASGEIPNNAYTIHHPNGDVKKISHDDDACDSISFNSSFLAFGHWKVFNWEAGTTEGGSSGAGLFNQDQQLTGTLSGGYASCTNLSFDAFSRFDKMWDYVDDSTRQLKHWLDPRNRGVLKTEGFNPYESDSQLCGIVSNFTIDDELESLGEFYDVADYPEVGEAFRGGESSVLYGVAIGVKDFRAKSITREFTIRVYTGDGLPEVPERQIKYPLTRLEKEAMNYFSFGEALALEGDYFITISVDDPMDSIYLYRSNFRSFANSKTLILNDNTNWYRIEDLTGNELGASLLMQVNACSELIVNNNDTINESDKIMKVYPNPVQNYMIVEFLERFSNKQVKLYDMLGKLHFETKVQNRMYVEINTQHLIPGIYLVKVEMNGKTESQRIMLLP